MWSPVPILDVERKRCAKHADFAIDVRDALDRAGERLETLERVSERGDAVDLLLERGEPLVEPRFELVERGGLVVSPLSPQDREDS
jgi:hypothetical protein